MATITITGTNLTFVFDYELRYNAAEDASVFVLGSAYFRYSGAKGYGTNASATVKFDEQTVTFSAEGTTNGGTLNFTATPSASEVAVQHHQQPGKRTVLITVNASATRYLYDPNHNYGDWVGPYYYRNTARASGSKTVNGADLSGLVWISDGNSLRPAQPYISDGEKWCVAIPYMSNGAALEVCT